MSEGKEQTVEEMVHKMRTAAMAIVLHVPDPDHPDHPKHVFERGAGWLEWADQHLRRLPHIHRAVKSGVCHCGMSISEHDDLYGCNTPKDMNRWQWVPFVAPGRLYYIDHSSADLEVLWIDVQSMTRVWNQPHWTLRGLTQHEESDWRWDGDCYYDRESAELAREVWFLKRYKDAK